MSIPLWMREACREINRVAEKEDLDYADNYRCYRKRDGLGKERYDEAKSSGCCGSADWEYTSKDGEVWIVGCNYGH
tara:strand:+ start:2584 stop:2811 length:228 start_codon:yes stop_codon:yes gene_type:complete